MMILLLLAMLMMMLKIDEIADVADDAEVDDDAEIPDGDADGATVAGLARERPQTRRQASAKSRGRSVACAGRRHHRCVGKASVAPAPSPRVSGLATALGAEHPPHGGWRAVAGQRRS